MKQILKLSQLREGDFFISDGVLYQTTDYKGSDFDLDYDLTVLCINQETKEVEWIDKNEEVEKVENVTIKIGGK